MVSFQLNECTFDLEIEPLAGAQAKADRQLAWRVYLTLVTRPALRHTQMSDSEVRRLIGTLEEVLAQWPAAEIEKPAAAQLGFVIVTVIEMILIPSLSHAESTEGWAAVRDFCPRLARELAKVYCFPDAGANVPGDLLAAWEVAR
jgi:hypothetical protein